MSEVLDRATERFIALTEATPPGGALDALRTPGREAFRALGLPTTKWEEWRYTSLSPLAAEEWKPAPAEASVARETLEAAATPLFACGLEVFVDGRHHAELDGTPVTAEVHALSDAAAPAALGTLADAKEHPFVALNGALSQDGAHVRFTGEDAHAVHLVFAEVTHGVASHPRVLIEATPGSRGTVIVDHVSIGPAMHYANAVVEAAVGENASVDVVIVQRTHERSFHTGHVAGRVERGGRLRTHTITLGGRLVRNDLSVLLAGEGAECTMNGLYLGSGEQLLDNHTWVDHAVPHTRSDELYKGVLGGGSRGVFRGRVIVRPDAQKTDAQQSNPNLLLGDGAEIDTKPQLEIYADDVKCSHGSAIGRLDPEAIFYLQSRGIAQDEAKLLLTRGFAAEVLGALPEAALGEALGALFRQRLDALGDGA